MKKQTKRSDMKAYLEGWDRVNAFELKELRETTPLHKFRQFLSLMASAHLFDSSALKSKEIKITQKRWHLLRQRLSHAK